MDSSQLVLQSKHIITIIINGLSILLAAFMNWQVIYYRPNSGQSMQGWSLQRKLRLCAVLSCLVTKVSETTYYLAFIMSENGFCTSSACVGNAIQFGENVRAFVCGATLVLCFLFILLKTLHRYASIRMITPQTRAYTRIQLVVGYFITFSLIAIVSNVVRLKEEANISPLAYRVLFIIVSLWILSSIISDLVMNRQVISLALKPAMVESNPVRHVSPNKQTKVQYQHATSKRLYFYYSALVFMDISMLLMYVIGSFIPDFALEANQIATSWIPMHLFIGLQLLNMTYGALKRCQESNFTSMKHSSGLTESEYKTESILQLPTTCVTINSLSPSMDDVDDE